MKTILTSLFLIPVFLFLFLSCTKDDATKLSISKQEISLKVGQSDTLKVTVSYTGDQIKVPVTVTVSENTIDSATILTSKNDIHPDLSSFSVSVVVKALSQGTARIVIHAGSKEITCFTTITQTSLLMNQSVVMNYGLAIETSDNNVFIMDLFPETFKLNPTAETFSGVGQFIHFESLRPASISSLAAGIYTKNINCAVNTFLPGGFNVVNGQSNPYGTYIVTIVNNQLEYTLVKSGQYIVSINGSTYNIEGDLTTETTEIIHFSYTGPVSVVDKTEKPKVVTPQFTKGELHYAGDYYNMSLSTTFFLYLETPNVNLNSTTLDGELLEMQFDVTSYYTNSIPSGTYKVLTQSQYDDFDVLPFTIVPGNFHLYKDKLVTGGTWYYNSTSRKRFISGTVDVTNDYQQYDIKYSFNDRIGSKVTGTFKGTLNFKSSAPPAPGMVKSTIDKVSNSTGFSASTKKKATTTGPINEKMYRFTGAN